MIRGSPICSGTPSPAVLPAGPRFETCCSRGCWPGSRHRQVAHTEFSQPRDAGRQHQALCALDPRSPHPPLPPPGPGRFSPATRLSPQALHSLRTGPEPGFPGSAPAPLCPRKGPCASTRAPRPQPTPARQAAAAGHWARADVAQAAGARLGWTQPPAGRGVTGRGLTRASRRRRLLRGTGSAGGRCEALTWGRPGRGARGAGGSLPSNRHVSAARGASEDAGRGGRRLRRAARGRRRRAASRGQRGAPPRRRRRRRPRGGGESCPAPPARGSCREVARAVAVGLARARGGGKRSDPGSRLPPRASRPPPAPGRPDPR